MIIDCSTCDKPFHRSKVDNRRLHQKAYCSNECRFKGYIKHQKVVRVCIICNKQFNETTSRVKEGKGKFCSSICRQNHESPLIKCTMCAVPFRRARYRILNRSVHFCSSNCQNKYQVKENNPNWKGGITPERTKLQWDGKLEDWRKAVFSRDDYTCFMCDTRGNGDLNAHHIVMVSKDFSKALILTNGITLCVKCHRSIRGKEELYEDRFSDYTHSAIGNEASLMHL